MWRQDNRQATLWWRDDDAQFKSPQLDRLIDLSATTDTPLVLATIPCAVDGALEALTNKDNICVVQHGWCHINHAPAGEKKAELGDHRSAAEIEGQLAEGAEILATLFAHRFLPVLVPPWNRISISVASALEKIGFTGLSTFGEGRILPATSGLCQANTHVDLIDWKVTRGFIGTQTALDQITSHLQQRRSGKIPFNTITGILTHHLDHDQGIWRFLDQLFQFTSQHPAASWQTGQEVFKEF